MLNRVIIIGRLASDPELRTTATGKNVTSFRIAVQKKIKPADGSPDADFFSVTAWGQTAEFISNYVHKGRLVAVDGRLQSRRYTTQDGQQRDVVEIVADDVRALDRPREDGAHPEHAAVAAGAPATTSVDEYDPFADE